MNNKYVRITNFTHDGCWYKDVIGQIREVCHGDSQGIFVYNDEDEACFIWSGDYEFVSDDEAELIAPTVSTIKTKPNENEKIATLYPAYQWWCEECFRQNICYWKKGYISCPRCKTKHKVVLRIEEE